MPKNNGRERKELRRMLADTRKERHEKMTLKERFEMLVAGGYGDCAEAQALADAIAEGRS